MQKSNNIYKIYNGCIDDERKHRTQKPLIPLEQNKRKYTLRNMSRLYVTKFKVEGCITEGVRQKGCEAILYAEKKVSKQYVGIKAFFVELKGGAVDDALKQIDNAFEKVKNLLPDVVLYGRIVPSKYRKAALLTSKQQDLHLKFLKTGGNLIIKEKLSDSI
jgi:hypothetical protein